jgi:hypothetical protein
MFSDNEWGAMRRRWVKEIERLEITAEVTLRGEDHD